jgi:asparagine synthetase B (glutamine-hydrolysing)
MCGILIHKGQGNNFFIRRRGLDATTVYEYNGFRFVHNLLHITGEKTYQPFFSEDKQIIAVFNGEIYNHPFEHSDGENIIPLYQKYGPGFVDRLDGEFAIVIFDFTHNQALFITDPFATKPLWRNGLEAASYQSGVGGHKIWANTIEIVRISDGTVIDKIYPYHHWNFNNQITNDFGRCLQAFEISISKRAKENCFIGLSSGYDSGAIACELNRQNVNFRAFSIKASENLEIIQARSQILNNNTWIYNDFDKNTERKHLEKYAENFNYAIEYDSGLYNGTYKSDYAAEALSHICRRANYEGRKVYLSGQGADEILSDYGLILNQSKFKGLFPEHPEKLEMWPNFEGSCNYSYLGKEECVAGSWSIETRYPFLDKFFVQEFLNLLPELKNMHYKSVLHRYLRKHNFPFEQNKKIGFSI